MIQQIIIGLVNLDPLNFIEGKCRVVNSVVDWPDNVELSKFTEFLNKEKPVIKFMLSDGNYLGEMVITPDMPDLSYNSTAGKSFNLHLCIDRNNNQHKEKVNIFIKITPEEFPYLGEIGDFIAIKGC
jgi:hypothetical protein